MQQLKNLLKKLDRENNKLKVTLMLLFKLKLMLKKPKLMLILHKKN